METKTDLKLKGYGLTLIGIGLIGQYLVNSSNTEKLLGMERKTRKKIFLGTSLVGGAILMYTIINRKK
ncbi:MAG: hypothetical protein V4547_17820 [Bacteroidota bacterium]